MRKNQNLERPTEDKAFARCCICSKPLSRWHVSNAEDSNMCDECYEIEDNYFRIIFERESKTSPYSLAAGAGISGKITIHREGGNFC